MTPSDAPESLFSSEAPVPRRGRPPLADGRTARIEVRFTPAEYERLQSFGPNLSMTVRRLVSLALAHGEKLSAIRQRLEVALADQSEVLRDLSEVAP